MQDQLADMGVNPEHLSTINHNKCPKLNDKGVFNININKETFSSDNIADMVRKMHDRFEGVEKVIGGARTLYTRFGQLEDISHAKLTREDSDEEREEDQDDIWMP